MLVFFLTEKLSPAKLVGIDFAREGSEFAGLQFTQGGWESLAVDAGRDNILISVAAAKLLRCRVGDEVLLQSSLTQDNTTG
jgi:ABC-type lipoprotein release transport system permease subunit